MGYTKVWIHLLWATKKREPVLDKVVRAKLFSHIKGNARSKNIHIYFVNGYVDHIHILASLDAVQSIAKIIQLIKGESSFWINKNKLTPQKFEWQDDYFAVSVGESGVNKAGEYIKNQEQHHAKKAFQQEYDEFIERYGFVLVKDSQYSPAFRLGNIIHDFLRPEGLRKQNEIKSQGL